MLVNARLIIIYQKKLQKTHPNSNIFFQNTMSLVNIASIFNLNTNTISKLEQHETYQDTDQTLV